MGLGAPAPGEAPGLQRFSATASSPRRDTRTASASATAGRSRNSRVATKTDRSTARGRKGRPWASPKTRTSPGRRRLASASMAGALSSPTTRGTRSASQAVKWPVPQPTSSADRAPPNGTSKLRRVGGEEAALGGEDSHGSRTGCRSRPPGRMPQHRRLIHAPLRSSKVSGAGTRTSSSMVVVPSVRG